MLRSLALKLELLLKLLSQDARPHVVALNASHATAVSAQARKLSVTAVMYQVQNVSTLKVL